jgi:hypothetical protein
VDVTDTLKVYGDAVVDGSLESDGVTTLAGVVNCTDTTQYLPRDYFHGNVKVYGDLALQRDLRARGAIFAAEVYFSTETTANNGIILTSGYLTVKGDGLRFFKQGGTGASTIVGRLNGDMQINGSSDSNVLDIGPQLLTVFDNTMDASSPTSASVVVAGGLAVNRSIVLGSAAVPASITFNGQTPGLSFYIKTDSFGTTWGGAPPVFIYQNDLWLERIGYTVNITMGAMSWPNTQDVSLDLNAAFFLASAFRPANNSIVCLLPGDIDGTAVVVYCVIYDTGQIKLFPAGLGTWPAGKQCTVGILASQNTKVTFSYDVMV